MSEGLYKEITKEYILTPLNKITVFKDFYLVATTIVEEGMKYFAVLKVYDESMAEVLRTAQSIPGILTAMNEEEKKATYQRI